MVVRWAECGEVHVPTAPHPAPDGRSTGTLGAMLMWPGRPYPLGATYDGTGTNFTLFSEVAERVELCLFAEDGTETGSTCPRWTRSSGTATCR